MSWRQYFVASCSLLCLTMGTLVCQAEEPQREQTRLRFHRLYLPEEDIEARTWNQRYLPVDAEAFERDLQTVSNGERGVPTASRARFERAEYRAQLVGDDLLVGSFQLHLEFPAGPSTLLSLTPCSLAIESARWSEQAKHAVLGADPTGDLCLLVEGRQLECEWSRRGERTASGTVKFRLGLPACPMSRIEVTVPNGAEVVADHGVVSRRESDPGEASRWLVELGGNCEVELRIVPDEAGRDRRSLTLLRQATTYQFSSRGINVGAQLRLDVHGEPLTRLLVDLDPSLHLIEAKFGELALPWSATTDLETGQSHVHLDFPEPLVGTGRVLQLSAVAPLTTGHRFMLPRVQPQGVAWQEGTADLIIPSALLLEQLLTTGCRQSRVTALPAPLAGESIEIQSFEAGAKVEVLVDEPRKRLALQRAAVVEVKTDVIANRCALIVLGEQGRRHRVKIPLHDGWIVETVESSLPNQPVDWDLHESQDKPAELHVELVEGSRIVVQGHRVRPPADTFEASQLLMLDFTAFPGGTSLVSVRASEGLELRWSGTETLQRLDAAELSTEQLGLFPRLPEGVLFSEDEQFVRSRVSVSRRRPSYSADIHIDAALQNEALTETFTILCTPDASRIERLLIHFSQPRTEPLEWRLAGGNNSGQFSARKLSAGEQAKAGIQAAGEVWEILLQLARPGVFELRAERKAHFTVETPLSLVSVEGATTQRGTLSIRALGDTGIRLENRGLMSVPAELLDDDYYQTARATYHYQPADDDFETDPLVTVAPASPQQADTGAWVWDVRLMSRFASDGAVAHEAVLHIETAGRRAFPLELPAGTTLQEAWIDTERLALSDKGPWNIELPAGRSRVTLALRFSAVAHLPLLTSEIEPPVPDIGLPVVQRQWTVWLPPEYRLSDAEGYAQHELLPPLSWSERLFGPLGRSSADHIFNPLVAADWREIFRASSDMESARAAQNQLLESFGTLAATYADDEELTCGQLLSAASETEAQQGRLLLVDADGLAEARISPQTRVTLPAGPTPLVRGLTMLRQARLLPIATPAAIIVTTAARAATYRDQLVVDEDGHAVAVAGGFLSTAAHRAAGGDVVGGIETLELWRADSNSQPVTWVDPPLPPFADIDPLGWRSYTVQIPSHRAATISLIHATRLQSLTWAVLLATVGVGLWRSVIGGLGLVLIVGGSAVTSLVVSPALATLFSAATVGGLLCLAARMVRIEPRTTIVPDAADGVSKARSSYVQPVATILLVMAFVQLAAALDAAEPSGVAEPPLYAVLVPIDADQHPVGDKYYVPDTLYEELLRRAAEIAGTPKAWIVTGGAFEGALLRDPVSSQLDLARLDVKFDLEVFQANVPVRLPLPRSVWGTAIRSVRFDGRSISPRWSFAGDAMELGTTAVGSHRLELDVLPTLQTEIRHQRFDLPIPRLGQANLKLSFPQDVTSIDVPSARGRVEFTSGGGELRAQVGGSDRLSVRWPTVNGTDAATANLEVEELIWIKVRPGTTVLDARFKYRVLSGRIRTLRLLTDSRLRLLTSPAAPSPVTAVHTIPGDPQRIELELAEDVADHVTIDLSFLVTRASGVGSLRLPRLESVDARAMRRWLGMSVDVALQHRVQAGEDTRVLDTGEFVGAWGPSDAKPLQSFSIPRGEPIWFLATQPGEPKTTVEQTTAVSLGRNSAEVRFGAAISISSGVLAQLAIEGPRGFSVESISVPEQDVERVARWSIDESGRVTVFLTAPIEGKQFLSMRGRWILPNDSPITIPNWKLLGADATRRHLQLYRQPAVLATVKPSVGARPLEDVVSQRSNSLGAPCGGFSLDDEGASVEVTLMPNEPKQKASAITYLEHRDDQWLAELQYHVDVAGGLADSLQFEIPPQWSEPFRVEPAAELSVVTMAGEQRRQLTLTPSKPLAGKQTFLVRGRVAPSPGDRLSVPDILPLNVDELQRFVVLPRYFESQQVTWDTLRLSPARLPAEFLPRHWQADQMAVYHVAGEHFQASLKAVQRQQATASVKLADIQLAWLPNDGYQASAAFDVEPGGATHCLLELPADCELVHLAVEQLPASIVPAGRNRFHVSLGPEQLPQRIELLYSGSSLGDFPIKEFVAPRLIGLTVEKTLWTVYALPRFGPATTNQRLDQIAPGERQLARLEAIADLVQLPTEVVSEHLPEEIARWYDVWRKRYWTGRLALRHDLIEARRETAQSEESIAARQLDRQMTAMDKRLGAGQSGLPPLLAGDTTTRLAAAESSNLRAQHFLVTSPTGNLQLRYLQDSSERVMPRWLAVAAILFVCGLSFRSFSGRPFPQCTPLTMVSGLAFIWWLLLAPSFLGLIALVSIAVALIWKRWSWTHGVAIR